MATDKITDFANRILGDWDRALDTFFAEVDRKRREDGLTDAEVERALDIGYGDFLAESWREWAEGDG